MYGMKVVIVGIGKVGESLATRLLKEKHDVIVVDEDYQTVEDIVNKSDVKGVVGTCLERSILADAEVDTADCFFACTLRDELNILSAVLAKRWERSASSRASAIRNISPLWRA